MRPAELFRRWFEEVWNEGKADRIPQYLAKDAIVRTVDDEGKGCVGPDGFRPFYDRIKASFPDIKFEVQQVIEEGDFAAGRWTAQATHTGPGMGVAPTHNKLSLTGMAFVRVDGGKIVEAWDEWDRLGLASAIGTARMVPRD
jgi:steroid delta-isomerase-like uncharacterized protein